jgi:hypothetical protein
MHQVAFLLSISLTVRSDDRGQLRPNSHLTSPRVLQIPAAGSIFFQLGRETYRLNLWAIAGRSRLIVGRTAFRDALAVASQQEG